MKVKNSIDRIIK